MSTQQHTTIEGPASLPEALNFQVLKELGLETIIQTGSQQWTDYNEHDPGITILEILTLAATDISYRTTFSIEDILTTKTLPSTTPSTTPEYFPDQFYTASEILTSSPVTIDDLRKKITDIQGIACAWISPLSQQKTPITGLFDIILNPTENIQQITAPYHNFITQLTPSQHLTLTTSLNKLRQVKPGKTIPIPPDLVSLLVHLLNLSPSLSHDLEDALNACFAIIPELFPEVVFQLETLEQPETPLCSTRNQRRHALYEFIENIFFSKRLPDDLWIPVNLRKALENIRTAASTRQAIISEAQSTFHQNRPIARDLNQIVFREPVQVLFDIDITLTPEAAPETTLASVLFHLKQLLSEPTPFLSLEETLQLQNNNVNAVFNGPTLQHGFINDSSLTPLACNLLASQCIDAIRHLPGVLQVNHLHFAFTTNNEPPATSQWTTEAIIPLHQVPVLGSVTQNIFSTPTNNEELLYEFDVLLHQQPAPKLPPRERDLPIPSGNYRNPSVYNSIQEDFPRIYELQPHGPSSPEPTRERIGEIRQLQAYLLIFDQILADYLSQLANIGQLYSWSASVTKTRFFQGLERTVTDLKDLVDLKTYNERTPQFLENQQTFLTRRNNFLDLMLCNLGRDLTYDLQSLYQTPIQLETRLNHRQDILAHYDTLSSRRGTGQNYRHPQYQLHPSGLAQWINAIAGFTPLEEKDLLFLGMFAQADLQDLPFAVSWMPRYALTTEDNTPLNFEHIMTVGTNPKNYRLDRHNQPISKADQKLWQTWALLPFPLTNDQTPVDIPINGKNQIVVSYYEKTFIFRVFNQDSQCILNLSSLQLKDVTPQLLQLKDALKPYWNKNGTPIPDEAKHSIISQIINLIQYTHRLILSGPLPDGSHSTPCQLNQTFADDKSARPAIQSMVELLQRYNQISQQITIIEHNLLRPAPTEKQYSISLFDKEGNLWASSSPDYALTDLQQISPQGQESIIWTITSSGKTSTYITSCLPPYITTPQHTPEASSPPHISFTLQEEKQATGTTIQITYGPPTRPIHLHSKTVFDSANDAQTTIKNWMHSIVTPQTAPQQLPWTTQLAPYTLKTPKVQDSDHKLPPFITKDPYSSIITIILPNWPIRFQAPNFRETLETIIRQETPSHLFPNILWVDHAWHQQFRQLYDTWIDLRQSPETDLRTLSSISKPLLDTILQYTYSRGND